MSAASYALRGSREVSPATRRKVKAAAQSIGYRKHPLVATLMSQVRQRRPVKYQGTLAFLYALPNHTSIEDDPHFAGSIYRGIEKQAMGLGFKIEPCPLEDRALNGPQLERLFYHRGIEGLIIGPIQRKAVSLELDWSQYALVAIGYTLANPMIQRIVPDTFNGMITVLEQLHARGYKRIGFLLHEKTINPHVVKNFGAAYLWYHQAVLKRRPLAIYESKAGDWVGFKRWVTSKSPDVVIGFLPETISHLEEMGLKVPQDIGFAGLDEGGDAIALSRLDQRAEAIGIAAVDEVFSLLQNNERGLPEYPAVRLIPSIWSEGYTLRKIASRATV